MITDNREEHTRQLPRGVSYVKPIEAAKVAKLRSSNPFREGLEAVEAALTTEQYLRSRGVEFKCDGLRLVANCPNPDHRDRTPSFHLWPETGRWYCFGACARGGDLLDAFMMCECWPEDAYGEALEALADRFGVELPKRPDRWHQRQDEKARVREAAKRHIAKVYQRRLTRLYAPLVLVGGQTPQQELRELEELAGSLWPVSLDMAGKRVGGEE